MRLAYSLTTEDLFAEDSLMSAFMRSAPADDPNAIFCKAVRNITRHDAMKLRAAHRLISPTLVIRRACRYCGEPMPDVSQVVAKANGDGYAHNACVQREQP